MRINYACSVHTGLRHSNQHRWQGWNRPRDEKRSARKSSRFSAKNILYFVRRCLGEVWLWSGVALLAASFYGFLTMLSWYPVSFVVPATSLSYVAGPLAAKFVLRERLSVTRWIGIILICMGVALAWANRLPALPYTPLLLIWFRAVVFGFAAASLVFYARLISGRLGVTLVSEKKPKPLKDSGRRFMHHRLASSKRCVAWTAARL